ncbi:MAG TPA: DUF192 domain-containing protein [Candidatus Limnocylindria bacterium]|nr:DUF192 domain-containing protein [Candidatus Limnocylindria bacterium]
MHRVVDRTRGSVLAERCAVADTFVSRGVGLIGRAGLAEGEALRITKTNAITMLFMRFAIDAVFVDRDRRVVRVVERLGPWVPAVLAPRATEVIELPAGAAARAGAQAGDVLEYEPLG